MASSSHVLCAVAAATGKVQLRMDTTGPGHHISNIGHAMHWCKVLHSNLAEFGHCTPSAGLG